MLKENSSSKFPGGPVVRTQARSTTVVRDQFLFWELRCHKPHNVAKKKKKTKKNKQTQVLTKELRSTL